MEYRSAAIAAVQGREEEALRWLDAAVRAGWAGWVQGRYNPMFQSLWGDPRYEALKLQAKAVIDRQRAEAKRRGLCASGPCSLRPAQPFPEPIHEATVRQHPGVHPRPLPSRPDAGAAPTQPEASP